MASGLYERKYHSEYTAEMADGKIIRLVHDTFCEGNFPDLESYKMLMAAVNLSQGNMVLNMSLDMCLIMFPLTHRI